ncbi:4'-phosphopantetheinyl transferase family protein [Pseudomonas segetis]|uniref:Enterobactin synthase component D n=1 Tax=Pseudomonas segetis TaxID=298908 RepID=A0A238ZTX0_9PSED|nr:4'-phosphopantetheinyl transferase superfamily protein [Pseudomonas segetis]SNR86669.1 enterobactin synthetase component D [Pseudomonas segetis]
MNEDYLPSCCTPLTQCWPLPLPMAGTQLISTRFDPGLFEPSAFERCAIAPVRGVAKRQTEYLAGRLCAREALRQVTGVARVPAVGEDRAPVWPLNVCGSISHGNGLAAAIVAERNHWRGLGLDIEQPLETQRAARLASEILTPREMHRIAKTSAEEQAWWVSLSFSLKESLFKALYPLVLTRFYFEDAELLECDKGTQGRARLRLLVDLNQQWPAGSEISGQFCMFENQLISLVYVPRLSTR